MMLVGGCCVRCPYLQRRHRRRATAGVQPATYLVDDGERRLSPQVLERLQRQRRPILDL